DVGLLVREDLVGARLSVVEELGEGAGDDVAGLDVVDQAAALAGHGVPLVVELRLVGVVQDRERVVAVVALDHVALVDHLGEQRGGEEFLELDHLPAPLTAVRTATPTPRISRRRRRATIPPPRTTRTGARARSQEISST